MKKDFIQTTKIIILGLTLTAGFAFAYSWTPPTSSPTAGNTTPPINSSGIDQYKTGALGVGPLAVFGKSWLWGDVSASPNMASNLYVSGNVGIGTTSPTEKLDIVGKVRILPLSGYSSYDMQSIDTPVRLCADPVGKLVSCPKGSIDLYPSPSLGFWYVPDGIFHISVDVFGSGTFFGLYPIGSYNLNVLPETRIYLIKGIYTNRRIHVAW